MKAVAQLKSIDASTARPAFAPKLPDCASRSSAWSPVDIVAQGMKIVTHAGLIDAQGRLVRRAVEVVGFVR